MKKLLLGGIIATFVFGFLGVTYTNAIVVKDYQWAQVSSDGFDDPWHNTKIEKLIKFKKKLYATTYNETTGVEVWRYDGTSWEQVNSDGFGDSNNTYISAVTIYKNKLYMATYNETTGTEIWYTKKGDNWKQKSKDGFNKETNTTTTLLQPYKGKLYAFTELGVYRAKYPKKKTWKKKGTIEITVNVATKMDNTLYVGGDSEVLYSTINGTTWDVANDNGWGETTNTKITALDYKNNKLFVGTKNETDGAQLWRYSEGVWLQVGGDGLGDPENTVISDFVVKKKKGKKYIYIGLKNTNGLKVFRSRGGSKWFQLNNEDGFGQADNINPTDMEYYNNMLFVSVNDSVWATNFSKN
ncbi:MAG: hypothetical protein ABID45_02425 [Patescibacteria group bacterium]